MGIPWEQLEEMARSCSKVLGVAKELEAEASAANRAFILNIDHLVPGKWVIIYIIMVYMV